MLEIISGIALNIFANRLDAFIVDKLPKGHRRRLWLATFKREPIRVSIAYLYRIKIDGDYLLVKGNRIDQFQPVGGVRKFYLGAQSKLRELGVLDDDCLKIDEVSKNDLRVRVPPKELLKLLDWYETRHDREIEQQREFREELVVPGYLPTEAFANLRCQYLYTVPTFHYSQHFRCWELLYHEIYEPLFTPEQEKAVRELRDKPINELTWVSEEIIIGLGHDKRMGSKPFSIGEHAKLIISKNHTLFQK